MMSVASVVSLAGPLLTYLAYSLVIQEDAPKKRSLKNTLRLGIVSMIKRIRSPKIVTKIKEVEVEKEVIKEVPIEKIRYEEVIKPEVVEVQYLFRCQFQQTQKIFRRLKSWSQIICILLEPQEVLANER